MPYGFVQAIKSTFAIGSPRTQVIPNTVFGNTIVLFINEGTTNSVNTVTLAGAAMTLVFGPTAGTNGISNNTKRIYALPVPAGGGSITMSYLNNGTNNTLFIVAEVSGLATPVNALSTGNTVGNSAASASYNLSPNPASPCQVFNFFERTAGAANLSGLSGTDRTGVTAVISEMNDQAGVVSGTNTVTATSSANGFGLVSVALALRTSSNQLMLTGCGT